MYPKLAGMTGTAMTEAEEFGDIYKLEVIEIPTNVAVLRADSDDEVYRSTREKYDAVVEQVLECQKRKQPVLCAPSASKSPKRWRPSSRRRKSNTASSTPATTSRRR